MTQPLGEEMYLRRTRIREGLRQAREYMRDIGAGNPHIEHGVSVLTSARPKRLYMWGWTHVLYHTDPDIGILPIWQSHAGRDSVWWGITSSGELAQYCPHEVIGTDGIPVMRYSVLRGLINLRDVWRIRSLGSFDDDDKNDRLDLEIVDQALERARNIQFYAA